MQPAAASSSSSGEEPPISGARAIEGEAADAFSEGLMGLLTPLVHKCDEGVQAALDSKRHGAKTWSQETWAQKPHTPRILAVLAVGRHRALALAGVTDTDPPTRPPRGSWDAGRPRGRGAVVVLLSPCRVRGAAGLSLSTTQLLANWSS